MKDHLPSSFRDNAAYVYQEDGRYYRRFMPEGKGDFDWMVSSGLSDELLKEGLLVPFERADGDESSEVIRLETLPFVSYPYEWCFLQLRDAALLTLDVCRRALRHGMILKDASAFNVSWRNGRPVFLDHGSFTRYQEGQPWYAYRQFVMHFLGPLYLMYYRDVRCLKYFESDIGGMPLDFVSKMLPWRTWLKPGALFHIHLHARMEAKHSRITADSPLPKVKLTQTKLQNLLAHLYSCVEGLTYRTAHTEWENYYQETNYSDAAFAFKERTLHDVCNEIRPQSVLDLGANNGYFSKICTDHAQKVIAADIDHNAIETLYCRHHPSIYPILQDLNNPSPSLGVLQRERDDLRRRIQPDLVLGLALIHHLRIGNNWPIDSITSLFASFSPRAVIEFVPMEDSQVQKLLLSRQNIYQDWTLDNFVQSIRTHYDDCQLYPIPESTRTLIVAKGAKKLNL